MAAPFPYFGGKSLACETVWAALGDPENYVEPFAGSAAMLLGRPNVGKVETINDADGFVANFWRAVSLDAAEGPVERGVGRLVPEREKDHTLHLGITRSACMLLLSALH